MMAFENLLKNKTFRRLAFIALTPIMLLAMAGCGSNSVSGMDGIADEPSCIPRDRQSYMPSCIASCVGGGPNPGNVDNCNMWCNISFENQCAEQRACNGGR
ncbi:MAG: hypothetical protein FWD33_04140 [Alphaproteobacteria bacterium]|nr:hypothetical protein [Alphaproteobacteria bacterium]